MIAYFCGRPRCGKSLLAEEELREVRAPVLYIGTLPNTVAYREVIRVHRQRRPDHWDLYECCGDPVEDLTCLYEALERYGGILLDGAAFYLNRALQWGYRPGPETAVLLEKVLDRAARLPVKLLVVDQPLEGLPERTAELGRLFHEKLYRYSQRLYVVSQGCAAPCTPSVLRRLDGDE